MITTAEEFKVGQKIMLNSKTGRFTKAHIDYRGYTIGAQFFVYYVDHTDKTLKVYPVDGNQSNWCWANQEDFLIIHPPVPVVTNLVLKSDTTILLKRIGEKKRQVVLEGEFTDRQVTDILAIVGRS